MSTSMLAQLRTIHNSFRLHSFTLAGLSLSLSLSLYFQNEAWKTLGESPASIQEKQSSYVAPCARIQELPSAGFGLAKVVNLNLQKKLTRNIHFSMWYHTGKIWEFFRANVHADESFIWYLSGFLGAVDANTGADPTDGAASSSG
jgi:hypothetical protein